MIGYIYGKEMCITSPSPTCPPKKTQTKNTVRKMRNKIYLVPLDRRMKKKYPLLAYFEVSKHKLHNEIREWIEERISPPYLVEVMQDVTRYTYIAYCEDDIITQDNLPAKYHGADVRAGAYYYPAKEIVFYFDSIGYDIIDRKAKNEGGEVKVIGEMVGRNAKD